MTNFLITRHGESCNNVDAGANTWGKDMDPTLTIYGIVSALVFSHFNHDIYQQNVSSIMVSNLVRTWITAFLLYGGKTTTESLFVSRLNELNLYVCPHLREVMDIVAQGNFPKPLFKTLERFLESLNKICEVITQIPDKLLNKEISDFIDTSILTRTLRPEMLRPEMLRQTTRLIDIKDIFTNFNNNKVKTIFIHIPPCPNSLNTISPIKIIFNEDDSVYGFGTTDIITRIEKATEYDTVGATGVNAFQASRGNYKSKTAKDGYLDEGDLTKFGNWYNRQSVDEQWFGPSFKEYTTNKANKVHIVGHSNVMVKYLGLTSLGQTNKELSKQSPAYRDIWWSNLSRFESTFEKEDEVQSYYHVDKESISPGTRILDAASKKEHKPFSKGIENDNSEKTTCGVRRPKTFRTQLNTMLFGTPNKTVPFQATNELAVQGGKKSRKTKKTKKRGKTNKRKTRNFYKEFRR